MALGIESLKKVAKFGITLGTDVSKVLADGKISVVEGFSLLPDLMGVTDIIQSKDAIAAEFADLDTTERAELNKYIQDEFDISDDVLENKIEKAVAAAVAVLDLVSAFKAAA